MLILLTILPLFVLSQSICTRRPYEAKGDKKPGNNGYVVELNAASTGAHNGSDGFIPGQKYKISIRGWRTQYTVQTFRGFVLSAQFEDESPAGRFEVIRGMGDARVSPGCRSAGVSHSHLRPKTSVHTIWKAPETVTGCVLLRASVIESKYVWYSDDSQLTKRICVRDGYQIATTEAPIQGNRECCACDTAKYELHFKGLWSKETHPKDFPTLEHLTHFTDMLGASHSANYSLWKIGGLSTDGMKEIAEWGNTYKAEIEAKEKAAEVRTLMKVKGLWYPEVQGNTSSSFFVNKYHHFVSLATMFGPSPDWCVGLSAVDLCLPDCTWVQEKTFNLLPFDAGTDSGPTYMLFVEVFLNKMPPDEDEQTDDNYGQKENQNHQSKEGSFRKNVGHLVGNNELFQSANSPAEPRDPIRWITTRDDPASPFYNPSSDVIPSLATLVLKRVEVTSSRCQLDDEYRRDAFNSTNTSEDEEYKDRRECLMSEWEPWSLCSATCGKGIRMRSRVFVFPVKAQIFHCNRQTTERQFCNAKVNECEDSNAFSSRCAAGAWESWSDCSVTCGHGTRSRKRFFTNPATKEEECPHIELERKDLCVGESGDDCSVTPDPLCRTTNWSEWSPCSVSCDDGVRVRTRLFFYSEHEHRCSRISLEEKDVCVMQSCRRFIEQNSEEICAEPKSEGQCGGTFPRYWFNNETNICERFIYTGCKGNRNQFDTAEECRRICLQGHGHNKALVPNHQLIEEFAANQQINDGGDPLPCEMLEWTPWGTCSVSCGRGKKIRTRAIKTFPRNGGTPCPTNLIQELRCDQRPCPITGCQTGPWSRWTPCTVPSTSCGVGTQSRRRRVMKGRDAEWKEVECKEVETETRNCGRPCQ